LGAYWWYGRRLVWFVLRVTPDWVEVGLLMLATAVFIIEVFVR